MRNKKLEIFNLTKWYSSTLNQFNQINNPEVSNADRKQGLGFIKSIK